MKKTFQLKEPGKDDQRVLDAIKHEVRKYVKRERRKTLTTGVDFWDFDCKVGASPAEPAVKHLAEVAGAIEAVAATEGAKTVYVEILAKPGHRQKKAVVVPPEGGPGASETIETLPTEL
jgi:hypothetical protein